MIQKKTVLPSRFLENKCPKPSPVFIPVNNWLNNISRLIKGPENTLLIYEHILSIELMCNIILKKSIPFVKMIFTYDSH